MTNITLSINDDIYKKMKRYSEIKWSDFVRKVIEKRIKQMEHLDKDDKYEKSPILADQRLLAIDWPSKEDHEAWRNL